MDIGGKNLKYAIYLTNSKDRFLYGKIPCSPIMDFLDAFNMLNNYIKHTTNESIDYVIVSTSATVTKETHYYGLKRLYSALSSIFGYNIYFMGRDGTFYKFNEIDSIIKKEYCQVISFSDSYWYGIARMVSDLYGTDTYIYVDMGSSSTSIIPVVSGNVKINPCEVRAFTGKLLFIGCKYTPLYYITNIVKIDNLGDVRLFPYFYISTRDLIGYIKYCMGETEKNDNSKCNEYLTKLAHLLTLDKHLCSRRILDVMARQIYDELLFLIKKFIDRIRMEYFVEKPLIIVGGDGRRLIIESIKNSYQYVSLPDLKNAQTAIGLIYYYFKTNRMNNEADYIRNYILNKIRNNN